MKPYYSRDGIDLILGDCLEVLPTMESGSFDAVVTDPPYGIGAKWKGGFNAKHGWGKAKSESELRNEWDAKPISQKHIDLILSMGTQHIIWGGNYFNLPLSRCWLVWNKPERGFTLAECELAWTDFDNVARVFDYPRSEPFRVHPTQKPLALMEWCIQKVKGSILDPFAGSGTTGLAAWRLGRKCTLIEIEERYAEIAAKRIDAEISRGKLFKDEEPEPVEQTSLQWEDQA